MFDGDRKGGQHGIAKEYMNLEDSTLSRSLAEVNLSLMQQFKLTAALGEGACHTLFSVAVTGTVAKISSGKERVRASLQFITIHQGKPR